MIKYFSLLLMAITMTACTATTPPELTSLPELTFSHLKPIPLKIGSIEVAETYNGEDVAYNRAASFPVTPAEALKKYLDRRFTIASEATDGVLTFTIEEASLPYKIVPAEKKSLSYLGLGEQEEYTLNYRIAMEQKTAMGKPVVKTVLRYQKSRTFPRSYSLAKLEESYLTFVEDALNELDEAIVQSIDTNFRLRGTQSYFEDTSNPDLYKGYGAEDALLPPSDNVAPNADLNGDVEAEALDAPMPLSQ